MQKEAQAFLLAPAYKDYLWGGTKLKQHYGKKTEDAIVAESWELSAHADGPSTIATGPLAGMGFAEFVKQHPAACGEKYTPGTPFPLLVKLIDAAGSLSIQVHPDDAYAQKAEGEPGKTEMWVMLACEPGAFLYLGFEHPITKEEMRRRIENGTLPEVLHKHPVQKGDVVFIPAGTIHAIGAGILLAEVQQNSNSTYRVYDFGRLGADGKPRPLHIEKALDVTLLTPADSVPQGAVPPQAAEGGSVETLAACPYFTTRRLLLAGSYTEAMSGQSFCGVLCTEGSGSLESGGEALALQKGATAFVPAGAGMFRLEGQGDFLLISL